MLLVGGTSRIPLISEMLIAQCGFDEAKLNKNVNADEAVARGAALLGAQLSERSKVEEREGS